MSGYIVKTRTNLPAGHYACGECHKCACECLLEAIAHAKTLGQGTTVERVSDGKALAHVRNAEVMIEQRKSENEMRAALGLGPVRRRAA